VKPLALGIGIVLLVFSILGLFFQNNRENDPQNPEEAERIFRRALRNDPASAFRWCDLGEALLDARREREARFCFARATELGPKLPSVRMRVANFHFRAGESRDALRLLSGVLKEMSQYDAVIFSLYARFGGGADEVLTYGIPEDRRAAQAYLRYLMRHRNSEGARKAWAWLWTRGFTDDQLAGEYVNFLLARKQYGEALPAWSGYAAGRGIRYSEGNCLFNGGFESAFTGAKLDWTVRALPSVTVGRDSGVSHSGGWSLRTQFLGKGNVGYGHVSQTAIVKPGRYRLRAYVKAENVTTDQGVALRVFDPGAPARLDDRTAQVGGTSDWQLLEKDFRVQPATELVVVQLVRSPSLKFDNKIAGTVWLDDVALLMLR
jgi:hypothetical protein